MKVLAIYPIGYLVGTLVPEGEAKRTMRAAAIGLLFAIVVIKAWEWLGR